MQQSLNFLASVATDYATQLNKEGHTVAAQLVRQNANAALNDLRQSSADAELPDQEAKRADAQG